MKTKNFLIQVVVLLLCVISFTSCKETSPTTGWAYNDAKNGGFEVYPFQEQQQGRTLYKDTILRGLQPFVVLRKPLYYEMLSSCAYIIYIVYQFPPLAHRHNCQSAL